MEFRHPVFEWSGNTCFGCNFESTPIPMPAVCCRVVGALQKRKQGGIRISRETHRFIGQYKLTHLCIECGLYRRYSSLPIARWFRIGVAIEDRLDAGCSRPESAAADFMRIGIASYPIRQTGHTRMFWSDSAGEASTGEIECSPEKMDGTHLPDKASPKDSENPCRLQQNVPEALGGFRVVCLVLVVLLKWDGAGYLNRYRPDAHRGTEIITFS